MFYPIFLNFVFNDFCTFFMRILGTQRLHEGRGWIFVIVTCIYSVILQLLSACSFMVTRVRFVQIGSGLWLRKIQLLIWGSYTLYILLVTTHTSPSCHIIIRSISGRFLWEWNTAVPSWSLCLLWHRLYSVGELGSLMN